MFKPATLSDLGYDASFETSRQKMGWDKFAVARVTSEHRGAYTAINPDGEYLAKVTGKTMFKAVTREDYPAVGDWLAITDLGAGQAVIQGILPRRTVIKRKFGDKNRKGEKTETQIIGANIDTAFIVESVDRDYNLNRYERYIALVRDGGVRPVIILNKVDLISKDDLDIRLAEIKNRFDGIDIVSTSTAAGTGLDGLRGRISKGQTYCFLGSSGVGKSSLINKLIGGGTIKTGDISLAVGRGKHVTTSRDMYFTENGGIVIDNPGMREVGLVDAGDGVGSLFEEISLLGKKCRFSDCTHVCEAGCAVLAAVKDGRLGSDKHANYIKLRKEAEFAEMSDLDRREKDRQFGKFVKTAKKQLKENEL